MALLTLYHFDGVQVRGKPRVDVEDFLSIPDHTQEVTGQDHLREQGLKQDCQHYTVQQQDLSSLALLICGYLAVTSWEDDPENFPILTHPLKFPFQFILYVCVAQHILYQILL